MQFISISVVVVVVSLVFSYTFAVDETLNQHWNLWKQTNNKYYSHVEEQLRRDIWENNLKKVQEHNLQADLGIYTYWLGMNKYADMTTDEFIKEIKKYNTTIERNNSIHHRTFTFDSNLGDLPDSVDWRTKGCVNQVRDQGQCGANSIFAVVGTIEFQYCSAKGRLVNLSKQQIIDCSTMGCSGGTTDQVFAAITKMGGLEDISSYPSEGSKGTCHFNPALIVVKVTGYTDIKSRDEHALQQAVATVGIISVSIDANHASFQLYKHGIYNEPLCSQTKLDLGLIVVGYDVESAIDYWIVQNSWGTSWGEQGYIRMSRNKKNQCGIATEASYPTV